MNETNGHTGPNPIIIEKNMEAQLRNNRARLRVFRRYAEDGLNLVFDMAPDLLNRNSPEAPGYVDDPETPFGVKFIERRLWLAPDSPPPAPAPPRPAVEGLFLIGSCGSMAHNADSDLDYWVCLDGNSFSSRGLDLFQRKLALISEWARREYEVEANFYRVELGDLAYISHPPGVETEGEVAPLLLLEELYRTFLFVAGRPMLWPALPLGMNKDSCLEAARTLARGPEAEFLDLGFPDLPQPQQALAAALWLAHKSEADPFKGLMKMTVLLEYVETDFQSRPLCEEVKEAVFAAGEEEDAPIDPYIAAIERAAEFGRSALSPTQLELLRVAAVLKALGGAPGRALPPLPPPKRQVLEKWSSQWGWAAGRLEHLFEYGRWSERERLGLIDEVLRTMVGFYIRIARRLSAAYDGVIDLQSKELAPFAARLLARQGGLEATLESLPAHLRRFSRGWRPAFRRDPESGRWSLYALNETKSLPTDENMIYSCQRAARAAAWLVHNHIYPDQTDKADLLRAEPETSLGDLAGLLQKLAAAFPPFEVEEHFWNAGPHGQLLAILNFEERGAEGGLKAADFVYRTGWGEMRHEYLDLSGIGDSAEKYLKIAQTLLKNGEIRAENLVFHTADSSSEARKAINNIRGALTATLKRAATAGPSTRTNRLDL